MADQLWAVWPEYKVTELRKLIADGMGYSAASRAMGISRCSVLAKARRLRVEGDPIFKLRGHKQDHAAAPAKPPKPPKPKVEKPRFTLVPKELRRAPGFTPTVPMPISRDVSLIDLEARECRYQTSEVAGRHYFCGAPADHGPFCEFHRQMSYRGVGRDLSDLGSLLTRRVA
jgi:hypothetical protein